MIKSLDDFKIATKRIPKILQTFDLTKPETFRLSNSAALNLMARILGYENYNTIKPVLEKNRSKGKKTMKFIQLYKNHFLNVDYIIEYKQDMDKHMFTNKDEYKIEILQTDMDGHYHEFIFNSSKSATKVLDAISEFMQNDETHLDLFAIYSKLQNTDNRSNQLNPNNTST